MMMRRIVEDEDEDEDENDLCTVRYSV